MTLIKSSLPEKNTEFLAYVPHDEAIGHMVNSSILVLIIPSHKSSKSIITGKIFEYLGSGRPVLCIGPAGGDAAGIIEVSAAGKTCDYDDNEAINFFYQRGNERAFLQQAMQIKTNSRGGQ
ncbi:MAG: hypothetical protein MZV63_16045 [Marinilabiliales bacterium]|nr:hypothetical protein [Marinilabiliales bacterium]